MITRNRTKEGCRLRCPVWRSLVAALVAVAAVLVCGRDAANASDTADVEIRIKAAFVYNFARFVEWPARSHTGSMRIAILGQGELGSPLAEAIRGKTANGRTIEVARISAVTEADCCEILVIERSESKHVREIVQALAGRPVLTVCDGASGFRDGVMIAFQLFEEAVRFQINQEAVERAGLKISSQLLKVALPGPEKHR